MAVERKNITVWRVEKTLNKVTHKMLTSSLRELEEDGFILRTVYPVVPPKVEYSLTKRGKESIPIISDLRQYGFRLMKNYGLEVSSDDIII
jgi:DNA-binding HxlR family transcriptional regulator